MMASEGLVRAGLKVLGADIREALLSDRAITVRYTPGNGTAYNLLFAPTWAMTGVSGEFSPLCDPLLYRLDAVPGDKRTVLLASDSGFYPWTWDHSPHVDYVAEKWARNRQADGAALVLLLAAISQTEPHCSLADADIHVTDEASV
jgi:hypothetical protein